MKNRCLLFIAVMLTVSLFASCSSESPADYPTATAASSTAYTQQNAARDMAGYVTGAQAEMDMDDSVEHPEAAMEAGGYGGASAAPVSASSRMVVRTVNLTMQTMEFDSGVTDIEEIVKSYSGFMQDSYVQGKSMYDKYGTRTANFTVRVPTEKLDAFVSDMSGKFNVIDKRQSGEDITDNYYDTDARLKSLKVQEERLIAMLEQAGELEYLLQVEKELSNVRYEIESLTSSLMRMENQVSMSTVYLYLEEVIEYTPVDPLPVTFGEKLSKTFADSLDSFGSFVQGFVLVFVWILPFLVLLAVIVTAIIVIAAAVGKRNKKKINAFKKAPQEPESKEGSEAPKE